MTNDVKADHVAVLMGRAFDQLRRLFEDPGFDGLRQSHVRVLEVVASGEGRSVEVARVLGMTKQGAGQLIATLVERGLVERTPDPHDARARSLVLTADGRATVQRVHAAIAGLERRWADEVGAADYAVFRDVLQRLVGPA